MHYYECTTDLEDVIQSPGEIIQNRQDALTCETLVSYAHPLVLLSVGPVLTGIFFDWRKAGEQKY